jgi:hypothetical protein
MQRVEQVLAPEQFDPDDDEIDDVREGLKPSWRR